MQTATNIRTSLLISLIIFSMVSCFSPLSTKAATITSINVPQQNDFVLEPGKIEVFVNPGDKVVRSVSVTNRTNRKIKFKVETEDFTGSNDPEKPVVLLGDDKSPYSFKDNLKPDVNEFTLDFGQRISIPVTIDVPANASPGGYYSTVLISNEPEKDAINQNTSNAVAKNKIISRLGVLFFIRVNGAVNESGKVEDFRISGDTPFLRQSGPVNFEVLFNNNGSIHLVPYGKIDITNTFGQKMASLPIDAYFALPNSLRSRQVEWPQEFLLGRYKAHLSLNRGYGNIIDEKTIVFWVIPWKILAIAFAFLFILFLIFYFIFTRFEFKRKT